MAQEAVRPAAALRPAVLVVDGDADTRALYRAVFDRVAHGIEESEDGAEALGKAICQRPDLIVTETQLRRIDGFALLKLLRSDPATRSAAILVVTSAASPADTVRALRAGADQVLVKPCTPEALVAAAQELCDRTRGRHDVAAAPIPAQPAGGGPVTPLEPRRLRSRTYRRENTKTPPAAPPDLHCPACDGMLMYEHSHTGGVNERSPEQWDYFRCPQCGPYQYRHRTRKLKAT
jgi:two-component system chemotaxis response regulator CheY